MKLYVYRNEQVLGPYSRETVIAGLKDGAFSAHDYAKSSEMAEYRTIGEILNSPSNSKSTTTSALTAGATASPRARVPKTSGSAPRAVPMPRATARGKLRAPRGKRPRSISVRAIVAVSLALAVGYFSFSPAGSAVRARLATLLEGSGKSPVRPPAPIATDASPAAAAPPIVETPATVPAAPKTPEPAATPAEPVGPSAFDPANLARNPAGMPKMIRLVQDAVFPAVLDGRMVGNIKVSAGSPVKLIKIDGENLTLDYLGGQAVLPWRQTNLEEAAAEAAKALAATPTAPAAPAKLAAVRTPSAPASSGAWMWKHSGPNYEIDSADVTIMPEYMALERALLNSRYHLTPEVERVYLQFSKAKALQEIKNSRPLLTADFLNWIDSDPIVYTTVYGARKDAEGILCTLRALELDLGRDAVRRDYTQLALAVAVSEAHGGMSADLSARSPLQLTISGDPRHPVDTHAKDRPLDVNDHIINFLEDHAPIEADVFGTNEGPPELKTDPQGVGILERDRASKGEKKVKRGVLAADVLESKQLQDEFNAYMAAHGQQVRIDCGDHVIVPDQHEMIVKSPYADGIKKAYELFRKAYEAKGRLPAARDANATAAERCAFIIRNDSHFPEAKESQRKWERFPVKTAPWPTMTLLAQASEPLREREEVWERFVEKGEAITYGEYIGGIAQQFDYQSARRLSPYPFTYGSFQMMLKDGGVCGTMATMSTRTHIALGTPACTAGQPGHCALIAYDLDKKTHAFRCKGEQYVTAGDEGTHPHANWIFGDTDAKRDMAWHQSVAYGVNAGFQSYLDSMVALQIYKQLPKVEQKAQGLTLLQSGLDANRYNLAIIEAAVANGDAKGELNALGTALERSLKEHGNSAGCPAKGLYNTTVEQLLAKHGGTMEAKASSDLDTLVR